MISSLLVGGGCLFVVVCWLLLIGFIGGLLFLV